MVYYIIRGSVSVDEICNRTEVTQKLNPNSSSLTHHSAKCNRLPVVTNVSSFVMTVQDGPPPRLNVGRCQFFTPVTGPSKLFTVHSVFIIPATS